MPKRVQFAPNTEPVGEDGDLHDKSKRSKLEIEDEIKLGRFKDKHSLDSDEEDDNEEKKYGVMDAEEIEGCEDSTIDYDDGIKITPFNMKEEMEEGHFDAQGNYVWKKEENINDAWMDNIDWVRVKEGGGVSSSKSYNVSDLLGDSSDDEGGGAGVDDLLMSPADKMAEYKKILAYMKPGETILKAIRRLGGGSGSSKGSASSRWKTKRQRQQQQQASGDSKPAASGTSGGDQDTTGMLALTGLADRFLQRGDVDIYQSSYEKLAHAVAEHERVSGGSSGDDAVMDMFASDSAVEHTAGSSAVTTGTAGSVGSAASSSSSGSHDAAAAAYIDDAVMWEYKDEASGGAGDAPVQGPYSSEQMLEWSESGRFSRDRPVLVRKVGSGSDFYSSARIDFELYT